VILMRTIAGPALGLALLPDCANAATSGPHAIDGASLGLIWTIPFAGLLLSMAVLPLVLPHLWHRHFGKIAAFWGLCTIVPLIAKVGLPLSAQALLHTFILEFIPFIILLFALYTITGGIRLEGRLAGSPGGNTLVLGAGTLLASIMGTTGASMLLIRPLLRANLSRRHNAHVVVFFIFLVANIGGALSPLGDPPLFLGFLNGIHFFWPTTRLMLPTLLAACVLLAIFFVLDRMLFLAESGRVPQRAKAAIEIRAEGVINFLLLGAVIAIILFSGIVKLPGAFTLLGIQVSLIGVIRDVLLLAVAATSLLLTPATARRGNEFSWGPILEVAKIFAAIFVTIIPPLAILRAGPDGALHWLIALLVEGGQPVSAAYFWIAGALSSFLDNAPTYLIFFHAAGGDPEHLMGPLASTLMAISAGAVYMGANTYIGNAPNFMVKSIAETHGVRMPSFFGYMAWSIGFLVPVFVLIDFLFL
jgi:Na+/H+ antiporter NhaD/arsenite permease-like protein